MINFQELEKVAEFKNGELNWLEGRDINAVYVILVGDEYYIGSSHYTYLRIGQHLDKLLKRCHHSDKLQTKFNKVGEFEVYSLHRGLKRSELTTIENKCIEQFRPSLNEKLPPKRTGGLDIRRAIKESGFTQREVAEILGITLTSLNQIMTGNPTYTKMQQVANAINLDVVDLFFDEGKKISNPVLVNNDLLCPNCGAKLELKKKEE